MMPNSAKTQPTADTSDRSSVVPNKTLDVSTEKLAGEKSPSTNTPCITIPFKNISASEQGQVNVHLTIKDSFSKTEYQLSETPPVSPDVLQRLQTQLTACYTKISFVKKRLFDTDYFLLADYFVNLQVVVKADKTNEVMQSDDGKGSHKPLRERDRLTGKKTAIAQDDLFQPSTYQDANGQSPPSIDTVVVSGAAGVGKTTLMDYLAYQWSLFKQSVGKAGLWSNFETVLIIRCRDLQPEALGLGTETKDIAELLRCACWGSLRLSTDDAQLLLARLEQSPAKCLLLLDGLDELPEPKETYWHNLLVQLFQLPFKKLVTTRPYAIDNLQQWLGHDGLVEIQGFSDEDVPTFFEKHWGATEHTNNFIKEIKQNPDFWAIAHIPINAYLIKTWWETSCQQDKPVQLSEMSVSHLYESLMVNVCRRYLAKIGELDENKLLDDESILEIPSIRCLLDTLGCWAFEGLRQDTAQLPIIWLKGIQCSDDSPTLLSTNRLKHLNVPALKALGLLKHVGHATRAQQRYEFLHLSFQEFLAARVIAERLREGAEAETTHVTQVIHWYKYHPNFTLVWPSVAGLLRRYPTALNDFLSILVAGPKDWVGSVEFDLLMRCLESSLHSNTDINALGLRQKTLLRAVKQRIEQFAKLPETWQWTTIDTLSMCPSLIRLNVDTVCVLLRDEMIRVFARGKLAISAVAYLSPTQELLDVVWVLLQDRLVGDFFHRRLASALAHWPPTLELVGTIWAFLRDETVKGDIRGELARSAGAHWLRTPELVDAVSAFLRDEQVDGNVRGKLAISVVAHWSPTSELMDAVLAFLQDKQVDGDVRGKLAKSVVVHLSQTPECVDAVLAFLRDETVSGYVHCNLAKSAVAHLSHTSECVDAVWALLRNETVSGYVRGKLAKSAVAHLSPTPGCVDALQAFLIDEQVDKDVRIELAANAVAHWSHIPEFVNAIWVLLRDETVSNFVRGMLVISAVAHWSHTPELVNTVLAFLRDETVDEYVRGNLANSAVAHLPQTPELVNAVLVFLQDEQVDRCVRGNMASYAIAHFSSSSELVDVVLVLLRNEMVSDFVRCRLAKSAFAHWSQIPALVYALLAFLRDETVSDSVRGDLASSAVRHLLPTPALVDAVLALLRDEAVNYVVRGELVSIAVVQLSQTPKFMDAVWAFLRNEAVSNYFRLVLAQSTTQLLPKWPNKVQFFLDSLFVKYRGGHDLSQRVDIPVHLLLPLYKKTHDKGRQYIKEQLLKHRVLVYEQAGTVLVTQAGQTEKLTLPRPIIQQIQKDLQDYRINIDDSANLLSKLSLFSQSVKSLFSSQHTEKRSVQTSRSNARQIMQ